METALKQPVSIFLSYARKDEVLKEEFEDYLFMLQQVQLISSLVERRVQRGLDWSNDIDPRLLHADLFLMLVSPAFLASGYCFGAEFREALQRRTTLKQMQLIPILLYPVNLAGYPIESFQFLPEKPVSSWPDRYEAWYNVDQGIRRVIKHI